jgi:hypothetical protein
MRQQHLATVSIQHTSSLQVNSLIISFDSKNRLNVPVSLVKSAFSENPVLVEFCAMPDSDRRQLEKAAPYVLEALIEIVKRAHRDPTYRNVYLNPSRGDQVMVCLDEDSEWAAAVVVKQHWEARPFTEAVRLLFDEVVDNLQQITVSDEDRSQLDFSIHSALAWVPNLYWRDKTRLIRDGHSAMAAHLANMRP